MNSRGDIKKVFQTEILPIYLLTGFINFDSPVAEKITSAVGPFWFSILIWLLGVDTNFMPFLYFKK